VIGVDKGSDGIPYALLADEAGYRGAAFISLPASLRDVFWRYVEGRGVAKAPILGTGRKKATWISPGLRATVRHLKGGDKLRHATVQAIEVDKGESSSVGMPRSPQDLSQSWLLSMSITTSS
jgi:hypothetical protein